MLRHNHKRESSIKMKPQFSAELIQSNKDQMRILWSALELGNQKCRYCRIPVTPETCGGIMPPIRKRKQTAIILCDSILCMSEYLSKFEPDTQNRNNPILPIMRKTILPRCQMLVVYQKTGNGRIPKRTETQKKRTTRIPR